MAIELASDTERLAYTAGYRYAKEGPGINNASWLFFNSPEAARAWERGKRCGLEGRDPIVEREPPTNGRGAE